MDIDIGTSAVDSELQKTEERQKTEEAEAEAGAGAPVWCPKRSCSYGRWPCLRVAVDVLGCRPCWLCWLCELRRLYMCYGMMAIAAHLLLLLLTLPHCRVDDKPGPWSLPCYRSPMSLSMYVVVRSFCYSPRLPLTCSWISANATLPPPLGLATVAHCPCHPCPYLPCHPCHPSLCLCCLYLCLSPAP
jgi:hypothetical protein